MEKEFSINNSHQIESITRLPFERDHCDPLRGNDLNCILGDLDTLRPQFLAIASQIEQASAVKPGL